MTALVAEGAREWETLKYDSFFIPNTVLNNTEVPIPRDALSSCAETGLTAFAQLVALRLNTKRALISLFDRQYQYIVAEATQKIPLRANAKYVEEHLWLCGTAVPRGYGICDHVIADCDYSVADDISSSSPHKSKAPLKVSVVPDLSQDGRFSARPFVQDAPHHKFYAGVPIRTAKGFNIGVLCVFDDKPRASLDTDELQFMREVSETIMSYLDSRRVNDSYLRSERMVLGLGNFIQGKDQPTNWWPEPKSHANRQPQADDIVSPKIERVDGILEVRDAAEDPIRPGINPTDPAGQAASSTKVESSESVETTGTNNASNASAALVDPHKAEVDKIFNKAANIIRESLDVDGAFFLDASVGSWGGLVGPNHQRSGNETEDYPTSSSEDSSSGQSKDPNEDEPCKIFALSTMKRPVFCEDDPTEQTSLTEKFLKKLLRRYPNGKIFSFDESGGWYSGESSGEDNDQPSPGTDPESEAREDHLPPRPSKNSASPYSRRNEAKTIGQLFPGARSVAMVPLWDPYRDRWYSGGFIWSTTPSRIITKQADLPYLRAFGMITMAEVTRLDVVIADKAKTDILGSLSHELRSPLHGVVAAAELLHDTALDGFQVDVVHTIEISGKTLLDTIDHLLAYSKVNTFLRASKSQRKNNRNHRGIRRDGHHESHTSIESGMMTLVSDVALDVLAEEVLESVFIGHSFQHMVASQLTRHGARGDMTPAQEKLDTIYSVDIAHTRSSTSENLPTNLGDVQVVIDIEPQTSWMFHTQPGAIRRIIMNLFGNALKYTSHGHIKICLQQERCPQELSRSPPNVILTVSDTGKGISEEFLRNKMFTPFSQEDRLAPGTGLGLSLVRQIVLSLGGSISVKSDLGLGTAVTVSLPLPFSQKPAEDPDRRLGFDSNAIRSLRPCTVGFTESQRTREDVDGSADLLVDSLPLKWYDMQRCERGSDNAVPPEADFIIYSEAAFSRLDEHAIRAHQLPAVVVCHNAPNAMKMDSVLKQAATGVVFEFVHQPNTPRKFGKTVISAILRWKQLKALGSSSSSSDSTLAGEESPPTTQKPTVHFAEDNRASSPALMTPFGRSQVDATCRLWNLDVDPEFTLSLPRRRGSSRSPPTEMNGIHGKLGDSISEVDGVNGRNGQINGINYNDGVNGIAEEPAADGSHFLVVDDNPINLKILSSFLKRSQRQHCTAMNGLEAVEQFRQNPAKFCCILMDINMPVMDGLESTRQIRQHERQNQLTPTLIIAITGLGSRSAREEAFASGLDLFLTRPVRMNELRTILEERGLSLELEKCDAAKKDHATTNGEAAKVEAPATPTMTNGTT